MHILDFLRSRHSLENFIAMGEPSKTSDDTEMVAGLARGNS
jgi:hypothetical protein